MAQITTLNAKLSDYSEEEFTRRCHRIARRQASIAQAKIYLDTEQEFILFRGMGPDRVEFKRKVMTGREAKELNKKSEASFMADKTKRLWRWIATSIVQKCSDPDRHKQKSTRPKFNEAIKRREIHPDGRITKGR